MRAEEGVHSGDEHVNHDVGVTGLFWWWCWGGAVCGETDLKDYSQVFSLNTWVGESWEGVEE